MRAALLAPLVLATACLSAPYPNFGEQLDVGNQVSGDTWVSWADQPDGEEMRLLALGEPEGDAPARFSFTSILPRSVRKLQGTWTLDATASTLVLVADYEYLMPDESAKPVTQRVGATRRAVTLQESLTVSLRAGTLVLGGGSGDLAGSYTLFPEALGALGGPSGTTPACAFRVFNLSILSSQVRIPGFGGSSILQYTTPATFVGELSGTVRIGVSNILSPLTEIDYAGYADFAGAGAGGLQSTKVNTSGNGHMYGTLDFAFRPVDPLAPVTGTVSYGVPGGGSDSIQLTAGLVTGGGYQVAIDGGASGRVDGVDLPPPSTATCLGLR